MNVPLSRRATKRVKSDRSGFLRSLSVYCNYFLFELYIFLVWVLKMCTSPKHKPTLCDRMVLVWTQQRHVLVLSIPHKTDLLCCVVLSLLSCVSPDHRPAHDFIGGPGQHNFLRSSGTAGAGFSVFSHLSE